MLHPQAHVRPGFPPGVRVHEVGPRDGLQNEPAVVPTATKAELVRRLVGAGLTSVEFSSFVSSRWVPQLGDAEEVHRLVSDLEGARLVALVPNQAGLERALAAGVRAIAVFASATEAFSKRNLNAGVEESMRRFEAVIGSARQAGMWVRGYLSMCFGDPWEGTVDPARVAELVGRLVSAGCQEVCVADTIGVATVGSVGHLLEVLYGQGVEASSLAVHFHDTYGQALANSLEAIRLGVPTVDASAGGLGGCPFAKSATGNLATEDLVWALEGLGVDTGVDLEALAATSLWMAGQLGRPAASKVVTALSEEVNPQ
jgi:hydroxymethylglutaryl-CoA lyase